jgi:hypothetical protein
VKTTSAVLGASIKVNGNMLANFVGSEGMEFEV